MFDITALQLAWSNFLDAGKNVKDLKEKRELNIFNVFSLTAFLTFIIFGILHIVENHSTLVGVSELLGGGIVFLNVWSLRVFHRIETAKYILIGIVVCLLLVMLITGGIENTGIFWFFTFPASVFYLFGRRRGVLWLLFMSGLILVMMILSNSKVIEIAYSAIVLRQLLACLIVVSLLIYFYQGLRDRFEATEQKQELEKTEDNFISIAAHQLRAPLGSMRWSMEMILNGELGEVPSQVKAFLDQVYQNEIRMISLIDDLLNVSKVIQGKVVSKPSEVNVSEVIDASIKELEWLARSRRIEFVVHIDSSVPKILVDPVQYREVVENLLSNAVKYNRMGGKVSVSVVNMGQYLVATVEDDGIGIPLLEQPKIFGKFFRASNAIHSSSIGTGLGLFVVKSYVENWGGRIWFKSTEGNGTTFSFTVPVFSAKI